MADDPGAILGSIACVVASSITTTFGLFFQKIAMERSLAFVLCFEQIPNPSSFVLKTRLIWSAGFLCITLFSFFLDMYSFATLSQSMVVPLLASLEVAENQMCSPCVLGERFDKFYDLSTACCCILGALLTTLFGPGSPLGRTSVDQDLTELSYTESKARFGELFSAPFFVVFEVLMLVLFAACLVLYRVDHCGRRRFLMIGYVAGFLGGQQNMFLKGVATLLDIALAGDTSVFGDWLVYAFVVSTAGLASVQLYFLNLGLAKFEAPRFVPTYTILYITMSTLVGLVFYQEYRLMSALGWGMFSFGFIFIGTATTIVSLKPAPPVNVAGFDDLKDGEVVRRSSTLSSREGSMLRVQVRKSDSGRRVARASSNASWQLGAVGVAPSMMQISDTTADDLSRRHLRDGRVAPVCDISNIEELT